MCQLSLDIHRSNLKPTEETLVDFNALGRVWHSDMAISRRHSDTVNVSGEKAFDVVSWLLPWLNILKLSLDEISCILRQLSLLSGRTMKVFFLLSTDNSLKLDSLYKACEQRPPLSTCKSLFIWKAGHYIWKNMKNHIIFPLIC